VRQIVCLPDGDVGGGLQIQAVAFDPNLISLQSAGEFGGQIGWSPSRKSEAINLRGCMSSGDSRGNQAGEQFALLLVQIGFNELAKFRQK
jgi:hypothetical protein